MNDYLNYTATIYRKELVNKQWTLTEKPCELYTNIPCSVYRMSWKLAESDLKTLDRSEKFKVLFKHTDVKRGDNLKITDRLGNEDNYIVDNLILHEKPNWLIDNIECNVSSIWRQPNN